MCHTLTCGSARWICIRLCGVHMSGLYFHFTYGQSACRSAEVFPFRWFAARPSFGGAGCSALREQAVRQNCVRLRAASALPCIRIAFCLTGCFPRRFLLLPVLAAPVCGPGAGGFKNNRPPVQRVRAKTEKISTEVLEVCSKSSYLCTTPQGRVGCSGKSSHERKKGLTGVKRGNRKGKKKKNFKSFLEVRKRFLPLQSRRKRRRNKKR